TAGAHGEPLGEDEIRKTKKVYGWPEDAKFLVPDGVKEHVAAGLGARGAALRKEWETLFAGYRAKYPDLAAEWDLMQKRELPKGWDQDLPTFAPDPKGLASRESSAKVLNAAAQRIPWLIGGAADLAPSTKTRLTFQGAGDQEPEDPAGRNFHFGIREHSMAAIVNGLSLSKIRPFGSTFLIFSDYLKPALRVSALMELPVVHVFTHDSIGVGEDGPTHQPVEQLLAMRAIPGLLVLRPCDANEVTEAWRVILEQRHRPAALVLSRQALPTLDRAKLGPASGLKRGGYVLKESEGGAPQVLLLATGSEVSLCLEAWETLRSKGVRSRVVSLPSWELFEEQDAAYQESVLPAAVAARVAVEQASTLGWDRYTGFGGKVVGMHTFGASAPLKALQKKFGFLAEHVADTALGLLKG
ncbi:MAG TPA: transketolase C-terminal domain-containing protein, partial [bacterium]|nr:transketolase C-terminal domain-containing protein [bacterium]